MRMGQLKHSIAFERTAGIHRDRFDKANSDVPFLLAQQLQHTAFYRIKVLTIATTKNDVKVS